jgi:hypothetical protein
VQASAKKTTESAADLIHKAQNLILQKNRQQSIATLVVGLKRETPNSEAYTNLKQTLHDISTKFLSDKAQQLYELAMSTKWSDPVAAKNQIIEALILEPENVILIAENAKLQIARQDCEGAKNYTAKAIAVNPYAEDLFFVAAQAAICLNDWPNYTSLRTQASYKKGPFAIGWMVLEIERALAEKAEARANETFAQIKNKIISYPESDYFAWRLEKEITKKKQYAQKYVFTCRSMTLSAKRKAASLGAFCNRLTEIDGFLKHNGAGT